MGTDYNELKDYGGKVSTKRTAQQTETALFWTSPLLAYQPLVRQLVTAKQMGVVDSARFMTLEVVALNDAIIAVLDVKYQYNFWRPITRVGKEMGLQIGEYVVKNVMQPVVTSPR